MKCLKKLNDDNLLKKSDKLISIETQTKHFNVIEEKMAQITENCYYKRQLDVRVN